MRSTTPITNTLDLIDSRDVIARIDHLQSEPCHPCEGTGVIEGDETGDKVDCVVCHGNGTLQPLTAAEANDPLADTYDFEEREELRDLLALSAEGEDYAFNWPHGETLIRDSYFTEYAQQLAEDIGAIKGDLGWPYDYIDWERAADALKADYTSIDFAGVDYWVRS